VFARLLRSPLAADASLDAGVSSSAQVRRVRVCACVCMLKHSMTQRVIEWLAQRGADRPDDASGQVMRDARAVRAPLTLSARYTCADYTVCVTRAPHTDRVGAALPAERVVSRTSRNGGV
jgi:hypothetical protein